MNTTTVSNFYNISLQIGASALIGYLCPSAILLAGALGALAPYTVEGARLMLFKMYKDLA